MGRVLSAEDPYFMLDLDNAYETYFDGEMVQVDIAEWALQWVDFARAYGLYIEVSPSGTGLKIIGKGKLPGKGRRQKVYDEHGNERGEFELYDRLRFTTITGDDICPVTTVGDGQDLIDKLLTDVFKSERQTSNVQWESADLTDSEVIDKALHDKTGAQFSRLWSGDYSEFADDESRAEWNIIKKLNFYTGDPAQTERIMRNNLNIARDKWDTHKTYLMDTITKAEPDDFYAGNQGRLIAHADSDKNSNIGTIYSPPIIIGKHLPSYSVDELNETAREETPWVIEGIAAKGAVTDFYGPAKHGGKTTFITHACASIVDGLPFVGREVNQERVLYLTEMAPDNFKDYLYNASNRKGDDFRTVFKRDVWDMKWDELIATAGQMCADQERGVLVVDTFAEFSGIRGTEENNAGDVHEKLSALRKAAQVHDLAVILIRHANKEGKGRGSSAFEASVDIVIGYKRPDKANSESCARVIDAVGRWNESNFTTNVELTDDGFTDCGDDKHILFNKAVRAIKDAAPLGKGLAVERSVFKVEGVSQATVNNALDWLVDKGELSTTGAGKKGDPYRFYVPTILSNNDPGPYTAPLLETENGGDRP
ncbi:MAG: AAA family ATPase [Rubrobacter sp.]|nr:AAA family ATPase [Rubrobacter sp.]